MRHFRSTRGPFAERPYFTQGEIENTCADALEECGLFPNEPSPIRIERFIEKRFGVSPSYDLTPPGVLGYTRFGGNGVQAVIVSKNLVEDQSKVSQRRVNSTLAHEAGHGVLHAYLFGLPEESKPLDLFGGEVEASSPKILCRDQATAYGGRWWEVQANLAMGSLLLPEALVRAAVAGLLEKSGTLGELVLPIAARERACGMLAELFDVNPVVARIRLNGLFPGNDTAQLTL